MRLTLRQFRDRLGDVWEIEKMFNGEGKGRIRRDHKKWREMLARAGKPIPKNLKRR